MRTLLHLSALFLFLPFTACASADGSDPAPQDESSGALNRRPPPPPIGPTPCDVGWRLPSSARAHFSPPSASYGVGFEKFERTLEQGHAMWFGRETIPGQPSRVVVEITAVPFDQLTKRPKSSVWFIALVPAGSTAAIQAIYTDPQHIGVKVLGYCYSDNSFYGNGAPQPTNKTLAYYVAEYDPRCTCIAERTCNVTVGDNFYNQL